MLQTQFKIDFFRSNNNENLSLALIECLSQLNNHLLSYNDYKILKSTLHFQSGGNYSQDIITIRSVLDNNFPNHQIPISIVNQLPLGGGRTCLEVWFVINCGIDITLQHKSKNGNRLTLLEFNGFSCLKVSVYSHDQKLFEDNLKKAFEDLHIILKDEGYEFSDIVRQWNYINDIVIEESNEIGKHQNYQIFNEYRALYYNRSEFKYGYPASTGIGMNNGGIVIEVIAQKGENCLIVPLQNPKQLDAHHYSENVLKGELRERVLSRPMFERGKYCEANGLNLLFVSGTASIIGEDTIHIGDVKGQVHTTIDNINLLISEINLKNHGITKNEKIQILSYVVYIKYASDFEAVQSICKQYYGDTPAVFLLADICRNELLVEIEANYQLRG
ncbi:MAG: hypothetical protein EHM93_05815 [Bacteroidales bacterium]|nr:MAG: hypothetical protein EHM93_05815 [Bacteroidales bacterium]